MSLSVIHSNTMAVAAMAEGKYAEAYDMLRMVLSELKRLQEDAQQPQQGKIRILEQQCVSSEMSSVILPSSLSCSDATTGDDCCPFEVYNRALVVRLIGGSRAATGYEEDEDIMQDITATTSNHDQRQSVLGKAGLCVLYNMGLCFQLLSNHEVALKFYQSVLEMADTLQVEGEVNYKEDEDDALLAVLASLNNMTCIHVLACDYSRAALCHKMLLDCLSMVDTAICLTEEDGFFFEMMNYFHPTWKLSTAPAA